jgi:hypothetical protein
MRGSPRRFPATESVARPQRDGRDRAVDELLEAPIVRTSPQDPRGPPASGSSWGSCGPDTFFMAVPPVLSDLVRAPNAPNRSGQGREDRRSKFYETSDNLGGVCIRTSATALLDTEDASAGDGREVGARSPLHFIRPWVAARP